MLSRVAENVYWMSRYIERAENYARFIDVNFQEGLEVEDPLLRQWFPLVETTGDAAAFASRFPSKERPDVLRFLVFDRENPNSVVSCVARARENARTIREDISTDMWEVLNEFYLRLREIKMPSEHAMDAFVEILREVRKSCLLFYGTADATLSHDEVWHFTMLGRYIERADKTTRILDMKYFILLPGPADVGSSLDLVQWMWVLRSASAHEMFNRSFSKVSPAFVVQFLLFDRNFPRSVRHCVQEIRDTLPWVGEDASTPTAMVRQFLSDLDHARMEEILQTGMHEYLDEIQIRLNRLGLSIEERFFRNQ